MQAVLFNEPFRKSSATVRQAANFSNIKMFENLNNNLIIIELFWTFVKIYLSSSLFRSPGLLFVPEKFPSS